MSEGGFGRRNRIVGPAGASRAVAGTPPSTEALAVMRGKTPQWVSVTLGQLVIGLAIIAVLLGALQWAFGNEVIRDVRLAGTWERAGDLKADRGSCQRYAGVVVLCDADILGVQSNEAHSAWSLMLLRSPGGSSMRPVRSSRDASAVSLEVIADDYLWDRVIAYVILLLLFAGGLLYGGWKLATGRYKDGPAFRALMADVERLSAQGHHA